MIRAVPLLVEGDEALARRGPQDFGQANRQAIRIARPLEDDRQLLVGEPRARAQPAAPLFEHDAALFFDLRGQQRHAGREVVEHQHALVDVAGLVSRDVEHVNGFVERCRRIDVRAEARADGLEKRHQLTRLEVLGAVERHVLEKVREPALVVVFLQRANVDRQSHRHALLRPLVLADEIADAIGQPSRLDGRVHGQRLGERQFRRNRRRLRGRCHLRARNRDESRDQEKCCDDGGTHASHAASTNCETNLRYSIAHATQDKTPGRSRWPARTRHRWGCRLRPGGSG